MSTGYTCGVEDGTITEFPEFAMRCAKAMGALVTMREEPMNAPIPVFEPSDSGKVNAERATRELNDLRATSDDILQGIIDREYDSRPVKDRQELADSDLKMARYDYMLSQVEVWNPPTDDHGGLKEFMTQQIKDSMDWIRPISRTHPDEEKQTVVEYREMRERRLKEEIRRCEKAYLEEVERVAGRNQWVTDLKQSLDIT